MQVTRSGTEKLELYWQSLATTLCCVSRYAGPVSVLPRAAMSSNVMMMGKCPDVMIAYEKRRTRSAIASVGFKVWLLLRNTLPWSSSPCCRQGRKKAYTTSTERKSLDNFSSLKRTFQASGGYENPIKTRQTRSTTEIFPLWTHFFSQKQVPHLSRVVYGFFFPI